MVRVLDAAGDVKVKIFNGKPEEVETAVAAFLAEKKFRVHGLAQSQSSEDGIANISITLLYTEYTKEGEEKVGFGFRK
jgi:hypothetical protein